jgi:4-diphosphocytidyl-2-C-methyl-D-erythritol kinase
MNTITLNSPAKLNLSLNLLPHRGEKGYYRVLFLNTQITLFDTVHVSKTGEKTVRINNREIDTGENIAYRAARLMIDRYNLTCGVTVNIEKRIPLRSGLGGGSSDAASVINGIDRIFELGLDDGEKLSLARKLGMDVCYCVIGGLCRIEGIGDLVQRVESGLPTLNILIATPNRRKPSTSWAYSILDEQQIGRAVEKFDRLLDGIRRQNMEQIVRNLHNDFECPVIAHYPWLETVATAMKNQGACKTLLAGSGLSIFGIYDTANAARKAAQTLESEELDCFPAETIPCALSLYPSP